MALDATAINTATLPGILAGPILRRLTRTEVAVWVALSRPGTVTLRIRSAGLPATEFVAGTATPVQVGSHLWLTVVSGTAPGGTFAAGQLYEYRLTSPAWSEPDWSDLAFGTSLPAFPGPPDDVEDLVVLHTSCRKAHGGGRDGLANAAAVVRDRLAGAVANARPHLLVLSGDQIYADEVPAPLAPRIRRVAADLVGIDESAVFGPLPRIAGRQIPSESFGLTSSAASDHLWGLGEYLATYLLYWSDVLWPTALPAWTDVTPATDLDPAAALDEDGWNELLHALAPFREGLGDVRKVLATVPSLMVMDDHEVTDDWNLDHPWAAAVYANPAASRIVLNGVLAYALCQHWGNVPDRFATAGTPEAALLAAAAFTGTSPDTPANRGLLGVPTAAPPVPPSVLRDLTAPGALRYDLSLGPADGWPVRIVVFDERTAREFVRVDHPAARISMAALALMLPQPADTAAATLVVAPSPVLGTHLIEHVIQPLASLLPGGSEFSDFESWSAATRNHQELLRLLTAYAPLVLLSGDVHYSVTASLDYQRGATTAKAVGVTSSSAKNAETKTLALHLFGDFAMRVGIERPRRFVGFNALSAAQRAQLASPPGPAAVVPYDHMVDIMLGRVFRAGQESPTVLSAEVATAYGLGAGDWHYDIDPVDDETMPAPGPLLTDITAAPAPPWPTWDPTKSYTMLKALRACDLHRIGRMYDGLPQISLLEFTAGPLTVHHHVTSPVGDDPAGTGVHHCDTSVVIG
jgi:hypothetical protein